MRILITDRMAKENPEHFTVDAVQAAGIREFVDELIERSQYVTLRVPPKDFGAWLVALNLSHFDTHTAKSGYQHAAGRAWTRFSRTFGTASVLVSSDATEGDVAEWITYPDSEGDRRWSVQVVLTNASALNRTGIR